jgi:ABC-type lipopolysaccharide export system ATPase subunit
MSAPAPVLEIEGLTKRYPTLTALDDVSLSIEAGEIFALLGPNGAGKTTLIGAVCGLVRKSAGRIRLFGSCLDQDPLSPRYHVGLVPQEVNFDPFFTVAEALEIQLGYYGRARDPQRIQEVLTALSLESKAGARTRRSWRFSTVQASDTRRLRVPSSRDSTPISGACVFAARATRSGMCTSPSGHSRPSSRGSNAAGAIEVRFLPG